MNEQPTSFTDNQSREWHLVIDVNAARAVRKLCGVNILDVRDGLPKLSEDPILLVDTLYVLCRDQCERQGVSDEDFGRGLIGEAIDDAGDALVAALIEFFPEKKRAILRQMVEATRELQKLLEQKAETELPAALQKLKLLTDPKRSSTAAPASLASTRGAGRSGA